MAFALGGLGGSTCCCTPPTPTTLCGNCQLPQTIHITDSHTTVACVWNSVLHKWIGCYLMTVSSVVSPCACFNGTAPTGGGSIMIKYQISASASGDCILFVDRLWPACNSVLGEFYCAGTWVVSTCGETSVTCSGQPNSCGFAGIDSDASTGCNVPGCVLPVTCTLALASPYGVGGITSPLGPDIVIDV